MITKIKYNMMIQHQKNSSFVSEKKLLTLSFLVLLSYVSACITSAASEHIGVHFLWA